MPLGSSAALIARIADKPRRIAQAGQFGQLHLADAVLGRDRAARRGDEIVDIGGDRLALALDPGLALAQRARGR